MKIYQKHTYNPYTRTIMQSKKMSVFEVIFNQVTGLILSLVIFLYLMPVFFDVEPTIQDSLGMTIIFTITSIIRSYLVRRMFNKLHTLGY